MFSEREKDIIKSLYSYEMNKFYKKIKEKEIYHMIWKNGTTIYAYVDSLYETDNNLELDDPDYEDFTGIAIFIKKINNFDDRDMLFPDASINSDNIHDWFKEGHLYELNYHNFPDEIYNSKGELISKKEV